MLHPCFAKLAKHKQENMFCNAGFIFNFYVVLERRNLISTACAFITTGACVAHVIGKGFGSESWVEGQLQACSL